MQQQTMSTVTGRLELLDNGRRILAVLSGQKPFYLSVTDTLTINEMLQAQQAQEIRRQAEHYQQNMKRFFR